MLLMFIIFELVWKATAAAAAVTCSMDWRAFSRLEFVEYHSFSVNIIDSPLSLTTKLPRSSDECQHKDKQTSHLNILCDVLHTRAHTLTHMYLKYAKSKLRENFVYFHSLSPLSRFPSILKKMLEIEISGEVKMEWCCSILHVNCIAFTKHLL